MENIEPKKKSSRCHANGCNKKIGTLPFACSYCSQKFCVIHRLPESHNCECIEQMRTMGKDKLEATLMKNKCVAAKV